jgi:hypothetical protein
MGGGLASPTGAPSGTDSLAFCFIGSASPSLFRDEASEFFTSGAGVDLFGLDDGTAGVTT